MAKLLNGILGPISGTIGNIVGSKWRGVYYIRSKSRKCRKARSAKQLASQAKFKFLQEFILPFKPYFTVGFQNVSIFKSEWNSAFSANHKSVRGEYPDFSIDYTLMSLSEGLQPNLRNATIHVAAADRLVIDWDFLQEPMAKPEDQLVFVVYNAELHKAFGTVGGVSRSDQTYSFTLHPSVIGKDLEVFIYVAALKRNMVSATQYMGRVNTTN